MLPQFLAEQIQAFKARLLKSIRKPEKGIYRYEQIKKKRPKAELKESHGQFELPTTSRPISAFVGGACLSLIWNGLNAIFLIEAISFLIKKDALWNETLLGIGILLFLVPFLLIGSYLILQTTYYFFNLNTPSVRLFVNQPATELGEPLSITWQFCESIASVRRLSVQLVGTEWTRFREGTQDSFDTVEFYCANLFETDQQSEMTYRNIEIKIPSKTMHSFDASHNKIIWSIRFNGEIAFWPDVNDNFEIVVQPGNRLKETKHVV